MVDLEESGTSGDFVVLCGLTSDTVMVKLD